jgi:hypothetical protein
MHKQKMLGIQSRLAFSNGVLLENRAFGWSGASESSTVTTTILDPVIVFCNVQYLQGVPSKSDHFR